MIFNWLYNIDEELSKLLHHTIKNRVKLGIIHVSDCREKAKANHEWRLATFWLRTRQTSSVTLVLTPKKKLYKKIW